jgi:GNAT superfamily N-acetyltransferase
MITIREATPDDVHSIHELVIELAIYEKAPNSVLATSSDLHKILFTGEKSKVGQPSAFAHVATLEDGTVIGFALWFLNYSTWLGKHGIYLEDLYVKEEYRGLGAGKALLKKLASICVERDYGRLEWWVLDWNKPAIDFYLGIDALPMDEWTVYRLTGDALNRLGKS